MSDGLYKGSHIATFQGKFVDPLNLTPDDIDIFDIAHALSQICRYNGHSARFYSVAEHSVKVAARVKNFTRSKIMVLAALMHDAEEAYLGDTVRPLKMDVDYGMHCRLASKRATRVICQAFGIPYEYMEDPLIRNADNELLALEAAELFSTASQWNLSSPSWMTTFDWYNPVEAERAFLDVFREVLG